MLPVIAGLIVVALILGVMLLFYQGGYQAGKRQEKNRDQKE